MVAFWLFQRITYFLAIVSICFADQGTVKWFDSKKGYGFITLKNTRNDIFVHYSQIQSEGFRTLEKGQRVTFHVQQSSGEPIAVNVTTI